MKKLIMTLAIIVTLATGAFAGKKEINPQVLDAFNSEFAGAQEVMWVTTDDYYKASFNRNGVWMFAYYNESAELIALARHISPASLPGYLQKDIKKDYNSYWIADLFEISNAEGTSYYATLQNAEDKIMLESNDGGDWQLFRKYKNQ